MKRPSRLADALAWAAFGLASAMVLAMLVWGATQS